MKGKVSSRIEGCQQRGKEEEYVLMQCLKRRKDRNERRDRRGKNKRIKRQWEDETEAEKSKEEVTVKNV